MSSVLELSISLGDYLEEILNLSEKNDKVRVTDLARSFSVAKPSITSAVKSLVELGLIRQEKYGPLELTKEGRLQALEIRRRHEILLDFLHRVLGVDVETAEKEACQIEHIISDETLAKLINFLNTQRQ